MKRNIKIVIWLVLVMSFYPANGQCFDVGFRGQVSSLFILRDTDGFQNGFLDNNKGVQWRNILELDLTLKPKHKAGTTYYMDKIFMSYRGAYDAIFELTDRYDNVREKSPDDYELGKDDIEWENDLREVFVDLVAEEGRTKVNLRLGRQIVRWGETDSFNVINVPNPSDSSFQMFFSDPDDMAIPLWMGRLDYTVVGMGIFDSLGIEILAIPDIRPTQFAPLDGRDGLANFDSPYAFIFQGLDGLGITRIREDVADRKWDNMEYAISVSFSIESLQAALHYFVGHQDSPAVDWSSYNMWASTEGAMGVPELINTHPRQRTYGYSFNYYIAPLNAVIRGEGAYTDEMYMMESPDISNNFDLTMIAGAKVYQNMLGFDKDLHPKWIGTTSALGFAVEAYWKHIDDWETDKALHPSNKEDTYIFTCLMYTDYHHGTIKPTIFAMYDTEGTWMTNAKLAWDPDGKWLFSISQMSFWGNKNAISDFSVGGALIENSELSFKVSYRF